MNDVIQNQAFPSGQRLQIVQGDLTAQQVDAIVNAANRNLQHGGGLARAIARKGGSTIQRESDEWVRLHGPVDHSEPAYTSAGNLPCRYVIHAVGPVWGEGQEDQKLANAVRGSLDLAGRLHLESLALPAIATGIFGFPKDRAARIILKAVVGFFEERPVSSLQQVRLVLVDRPTADVFVKAWQEQFPGENRAAA